MAIGSRTTRLLAAAALAALTVGVAAPAHAEATTVKDGADTTASLQDIRKVRVVHGADRLKVRMGFTDLRKKSDAGGSSIAIFIDTRKARTGPEFRLGSGLQNGTDYQLMRVKDWKAVGEPLSCDHHLELDFGEDRLVFTASRPCLESPAKLRIGAKMTDMYDASHPVVDWLEGPRHWTPWLASD
jgi:hypothetical protein